MQKWAIHIPEITLLNTNLSLDRSKKELDSGKNQIGIRKIAVPVLANH